MSIKAYSHVKASERPVIELGKWVCYESYMRDGIAQRGGVVTKVMTESVGVDEGGKRAHTKRKASIAFVCDTEAEMNRCAEVSNQLWRGLSKHAQDRKREAIEKLVKEAA